MTSLLSSSLNTLPKNVSIPTANTSSPALHPHSSILSRFLMSWVDVRLEERHLLETFDAAFTDDLCFGTLMAQLLHEQLNMDRADNNNNILSDYLSNVAQIVDVLLENENSGLSPSTLVEDLASIIGNGNMNATLEIVSCIILKTSMKPILLGKHFTVSSNQTYPPMMLSDIPTFQLGRLSLKHTFLEVRSALLFWVNQQFRTNIDYLCVDLVFDFSPSWSNGLAFTLLIYCLDSSYLPGHLQNWIHQQLQHGDGVSNHDDHTTDDDDQTGVVLSYIFGIAKQRMGMFAHLTSQDMLEMVATANEWCVMLYVYEFYIYVSQRKQQLSTSLASDLQQTLELVHSVSHAKNDKNFAVPLHPLDGIDGSIISDYSQKVAMAVSLWNVYSSKCKIPAPHLLTSVSTMRRAYDLFTQGLAFTQIGKQIQADLNTVEATMNDMGSSLTLDSVRQLEYQVDNVKSLLYDMETQFSVLVQQQRYSDHLQQLQEQANLMCGWTSQVHAWMSKNDCIRERIQLWVDLIEERNAITDDLQCDAMTTMDLTALDHLDTTTLYYEHEQLKKDMDQFEAADDTKQLREHIKQHTTTSDEQQLYLTSVNMTTLGISLITLNNLDHLWNLVVARGLLIERLVCRLQWEHLFEKAVEWIFLKDAEIDTFLRTQALWCEQVDDGFNDTAAIATNTALVVPSSQLYYQGQGIAEQKIDILMHLEHDISDFDGNSFMGVWDAYQEMVDLFTNVPSFLKQRQTGFEAAFEDLTKRCGLVRQAVEQQLAMMDIGMQFKNIKNDGGALRRKLLVENDTMDGTFGNNKNDNSDCDSGASVGNNGNNGNNGGSGGGLCGNDTADTDNNAIELCVEKFREAYTGFLAHARARIPYLKAPAMSTAMGALDSQYTDTTNDAIRNALHTYGISLSLVLDGLDQLLMMRQHMRSLQQRATRVCQQMERFTNWMDERRCSIEKSDFTIYDNKNDGRTNMADFTSQPILRNKNELITGLEKELGTITHRLQQMEDDDVAKLLETVKVLQSDMDGTNTVSICRHNVNDALECLTAAQHDIKTAIQERGNKLDALKRYLAWQSHWIKSRQWIMSMARKLLNFCVKKAKYCPSVADSASKSSCISQRDVETALRSHQDRITDIGGNHMAVLADLYTGMVDGINNWEKALLAKNSSQASGANGNGVRHSGSSQIVPGLSTRQSMVVQEHRTLVDLSHYAATLVTQRSVISDILMQLDNASREGERLRDRVAKSIQHIMKIDLHQPKNSQQRQSPKEKVDLFRQLVAKIKKTSTILKSPTFLPTLKNGEPDSIISSVQIQQLQQDDAQTLVASKMDELEALDGHLTELLKVFDKAEKKKKLVDQYNADVLALTRWIQDQTVVLENRHLNVAAEAMDELLNGTSWIDLDEQHQQFVSMIGSFEVDRLKIMHDKVVILVEDVATQSGQIHGGSLDVTVAVTQNLGTAINSFTELQQKVADEAVTIDAVGKRIEWTKVLQDANGQLEGLQRRLAAWCKKMDEWVNDNSLVGVNSNWQEEAHEQVLAELYQDMGNMMNDRDEFTKSTMDKVRLLYDTFVQCFPKLPRPTATPDHIEDTMVSLDGLNVRCQEALVSKNKELDIIQSYIQWNTNYKMVHLASMDCLDGLNLFVTHTARWRPMASKKKHGNGDDQESSLGYSNNIHQQCTDLAQQLHDLESRLDILYDDATTNNVSNAIMQRGLSQRDQLAFFSRYIPQLACFMDLVINQNQMVQDLLVRMSRTGGKLTLLLAGSTPDSLDSINLHTSIVAGDHYYQVIKQVDQLRSDIAKMIYPVRPTIDYSNTSGGGMVMGNDSSYWVALDHTDNNVIQNILTGNLMELEHNLMEMDHIIQASEQQPQRLTDSIPSKQKNRPSNITVETKKTQGADEVDILDTQNGAVGHLTKSLSLNNYSMSSLSKQRGQQVLKARFRRPTTKIIPGQVGKYWIGNSQPRLIYCRVLKSNAVMARVGGGWMELSQFLLDHGCNDGSVILDEPDSSETISPVVPVENLAVNDYENIEKSESSASLTLSRSSGKTSTSTRSLLPMAGYTDGYQYVRIDEWGNHLALSMVRVDDHYFISQK